MKNDRINKGFTLVELLIVITIIASLLALLSTAVLQVMKNAKLAQRKNEAAVIRGAIMEYWYDNKRWPIPSGSVPNGASTVVFAENNHKVMNLLINDETLSPRKKYLDPANYSTLTGAGGIFPVSPYNLEKNISGDDFERPIVYVFEYMKCPVCEGISDAKTQTCGFKACKDMHGGIQGYAFRASDRSRARSGAYPYEIRFNFRNDAVEVLYNPRDKYYDQ